MAMQNIIDEDGEWVVNTGVFPFVDPTTGVRYEPNQRTKVKVNDWLEGQPVFKIEGREEKDEDGDKGQKPVPPAPAPAPAPTQPGDKK